MYVTKLVQKQKTKKKKQKELLYFSALKNLINACYFLPQEKQFHNDDENNSSIAQEVITQFVDREKNKLKKQKGIIVKR